MTRRESRRAERYPVARPATVVDSMTGQPIGRIGNISETGMLLIAQVELVEDALYQLQLQPSQGTAIDVGAHLLWSSPASSPGQSWAGVRFLTMSAAHREALRQWLATLATVDPA
ncbi:MAG: PilZ domain-containing protein [Pseudomonas sp.]